VRWTKETAEEAGVDQFGFTLEEVQNFKSRLDKSNSDIAGEAASKKVVYEGEFSKMKELGVKENSYTSLTP